MEENDYLLVGKSKHRKKSFIRRLWHTDWCPWIPARYVLAIMSFLGFVNVYILRVNLSMALVALESSAASMPHSAFALASCTHTVI